MRYFHRIRVVVSGLTCREIERTALETQEKRDCRNRMKAVAGTGVWSGPKVAAWMAEQLGRAAHAQRAWEVLRRLGVTLQRLRPRHRQADAAAQAAFK